jgi:hypothetical protein
MLCSILFPELMLLLLLLALLSLLSLLLTALLSSISIAVYYHGMAITGLVQDDTGLNWFC